MAESAQITLAGAAATRLLPTAGAGGAAMTLWTMRRAGLRAGAATRTLLVFLVALYSVFLIAIVLSGAALALGLVSSRGPVALPAVLAYRTIAVWLPVPVAIAAVPRLRATTARWAREDMPDATSEKIPSCAGQRSLRTRSDRLGSLVAS